MRIVLPCRNKQSLVLDTDNEDYVGKAFSARGRRNLVEHGEETIVIVSSMRLLFFFLRSLKDIA